MIKKRDNVPGAARFQRAHPAAHPDADLVHNRHNGSVAKHSSANPITPMFLGLSPSSSEKIPYRTVVSLVTVARQNPLANVTGNVSHAVLGASSSTAIGVGYTHGAAVTPLMNSGFTVKGLPEIFCLCRVRLIKRHALMFRCLSASERSDSATPASHPSRLERGMTILCHRDHRGTNAVSPPNIPRRHLLIPWRNTRR